MIFYFFANKLVEACFNSYAQQHKRYNNIYGTWAQIFVQVCAWSVYLFLSWWALFNNLIWSCILCYGHEVMRAVNKKTAGKTNIDLMTDNILQLQQKNNFPRLIVVIGEKVVLNEPDNQHY